MVRLDVLKSRELLATIYALRAIDKTLATQIRRHVKAIGQPEWSKALAERADSKLEHRVLVDTAVLSVSNQNVRLQSASKGRALKGGLQPKTQYAPVEYGAAAKKVTYQRRSQKGKTHSVTRNTRAPFKAPRRGGHVFGPASKSMVPRFASLFVQTTVKTIANALEGKQE